MSEREYLEERAARWLIRQEEPDWSPEAQKELDAWLEASLAHQATFWRLSHGWELANAAAPTSPSPRIRIPKPVVALAASLALVVLASLFWFTPKWDRPVETIAYATGRGQMSKLRLADGTKIELNTDTSVRVEQSDRSRVVWVDSGEAFFDVAHDQVHPFVVHAGPRNIVVLGTKFNVRREKRAYMVVSVVEGSVRVANPSASGNLTSAVITRGDRAIVDGSSTLITSDGLDRIEHDLAWRTGMISFDQAPLARVVEEFNRYNKVQLAVDDPKIASIMIGGTLRAGNTAGFVRLLHEAYGITAERQGDKVILREN